MPDKASRVLIVEDEYLIAQELVKGFRQAGYEIVGPVPSLARATATLAQEQIDAALLDINLDGEKVWELADALIERGIPVVFVTGYERTNIPPTYADVPLCLKPVETDDIIRALERVVAR